MPFPRFPFSTELQVGGRAHETLCMRFGMKMWSSSHIPCMLWRSVKAPGAVADLTHCCWNTAQLVAWGSNQVQLLTSFLLSSNLSHTQGWCIFGSIKNGSSFSYRSFSLSTLVAEKWWERLMGSSGFLWDSPQPLDFQFVQASLHFAPILPNRLPALWAQVPEPDTKEQPHIDCSTSSHS